ncbi:MAG: phytanoyl-CoA dioxygenase family protein, partial [Acidimicrobiales bacterium]|nr:phytanoyl-CoA dioxygenase family protein [Acidimicrobiales bacterium]
MGTEIDETTLPWVDAIAASFPPHDPATFHRAELPALLASRGDLVLDDLAGAPSLGFRFVGGGSWTWQSADRVVAIVEGDEHAETLVELDDATFSQHLHGLLTASGAIRTERARFVRGDLAGWRRWEPAIQSLVRGEPIYTPAVWDTLVDRNGEPLDLDRAFRPGEDPADLAHFLATAGYLHVTGVFSPDEVASLSEALEQARAATTPGDGYSWWSVNVDGDEVVTRINHLERHAPALGELCFDERLARFANLVDEGMRVCDDRLDGPMAFIKNPNVVKGNGDLVWHVDDGLGGHPVLCPLIQVGVQLDVADAANGQLLVLAGSHRYTKHMVAWGEEGDLPVVAIETRPGDITL